MKAGTTNEAMKQEVLKARATIAANKTAWVEVKPDWFASSEEMTRFLAEKSSKRKLAMLDRIIAFLTPKPGTNKKKAKAKKPAREQSVLTARQRMFVAEYMKDLNATQAAIRAGYSAKTANRIASENLSKPVIAKAIAEAMDQRAKAVKTDAEWLLSRFREEAEADIADIYRDDGSLKPVSEWPKVWRQGLVTGIEVEQLFEGAGDERVQVGIVTKVKHSDRIKRLELIGRHVGVQAFKDRVVHDVTDPLKQLMEQVSGQSIKPRDAG